MHLKGKQKRKMGSPNLRFYINFSGAPSQPEPPAVLSAAHVPCGWSLPCRLCRVHRKQQSHGLNALQYIGCVSYKH